MIKNCKIIFILFIFINSLSQAQELSFDSEELIFRIEENTFYVSGYYHLKNSGLNIIETALYYPFPTDSIFFPVDSVHIFDMTNRSKIENINSKSGGVIFDIKIDSTLTLFISYEQKLKYKRAKYILTTTNYWKEPLSKVSYSLITPTDLEITYFSYEPDRNEIIDDRKIYYWKKMNFMPEKDMEFEFD